jgi:aryl-alcohol dehydrogenase-like predicted oxidoreductase
MKRTLGRSGMEVSALGLGCWAIGGPYASPDGKPCGWSYVDDEESIRAIHAGLDAGVTLFDTAACYGCGHSEEVLGRALKGQRDKVVIATKFGHTFDETRKVTAGTLDGPAQVARSVEDSLRRLDTDVIDLLQFHQGKFPADQAAPYRNACEELVQQGKIRWYGWSTDDPDRLAVFAAGEHCTAVQQRLSIMYGDLDTLALAEKENLASLNRGPLIKGLLTGKFDRDSTFADDDVRQPWWDLKSGQEGEWLEAFGKIREVLTADGRTAAQGAIGWLWAKSDVTIPIPGFKTVDQVRENAGAMEHGPLSDEQMRQIDEILRAEK